MEDKFEFAILNIDKPSGPTSFTVSDKVRKKLGVRKTSHFGTLDPKVTGVLPIALNRACKLTGYFIGHDKEYVGVMRIHEVVEVEKIKKVIREKFIGKIKQMPPVRSAVKRAEREREIFEFEILEVDPSGKDVLFRTKVEGGTYIRKLCSDLGDELGCGAHMLELRRTRAGIFSEDDEEFMNLYDLDKLDEKKVIPAEDALKKIMPGVQIKDKRLKEILTGKSIFETDIKKAPELKKDEVCCVFAGKRFVGVYKFVGQEFRWMRPEFVYQDIKG